MELIKGTINSSNQVWVDGLWRIEHNNYSDRSATRLYLENTIVWTGYRGMAMRPGGAPEEIGFEGASSLSGDSNRTFNLWWNAGIPLPPDVARTFYMLWLESPMAPRKE